MYLQNDQQVNDNRRDMSSVTFEISNVRFKFLKKEKKNKILNPQRLSRSTDVLRHFRYPWFNVAELKRLPSTALKKEQQGGLESEGTA